MIEFRDTIDSGEHEPFISPESITFDGVRLEDEIEGFTVISVSGRDNLIYHINSSRIDGKNGMHFHDKTIDSKPIVIQYMLRNHTPEEINEKMDQLKYFLRNEESWFHFEDEQDYEYKGTLSQLQGIPEGRLSGTGTITIQLHDPVKYKRMQTYSGDGSVMIDEDLWYETLPTEIRLSVPELTSEITITNETQGYSIELEGTFQESASIVIIPDEGKIIVNNTERPDVLVWSSELEDFLIHRDDEVSVNPSMNIEVDIRAVMA